MTAITYRKSALLPEVLVGTTNGISLRMPIDVVRARQDPAPDDGRRARRLLQALVAYKKGKMK